MGFRRNFVVANQADVSAAGEQAGDAPRRRLQAGRAESVGGSVISDDLR